MRINSTKSANTPHRIRKSVDFADPVKKLYLAGGLMLSMFALGIVGYSLLGEGHWSLLDCAYMTVITLTTVGYSEVLDIGHNPSAKVFTMVLILMGMGSILFFISSLTAFIVEGQLRDILFRRRMLKRLGKMENHIIICGMGETGLHVAEELKATHKPFVMIDLNENRLQRAMESLEVEVPYIVGDASDDDTLLAAGIERASGVIAACTDDKDNAFIIVSAKQINPKLRVVTKAVSLQSERKLRRAGADRVVTTTFIGGLRMASEMLRPTVTTFLDKMMREQTQDIRIEEVPVTEGSHLSGKTLMELNFRRTMNLTVMAIEIKKKRKYDFNPDAGFVLEPGMTLICLGEMNDIRKLQKMSGQVV